MFYGKVSDRVILGHVDLSMPTPQVLIDTPTEVTPAQPLYLEGSVVAGTLRVTDAWGGRLIGDGRDQTVISYEGRTDVPTFDIWRQTAEPREFTPAFWAAGMSSCEINGISFVNTAAMTDPSPIAGAVTMIPLNIIGLGEWWQPSNSHHSNWYNCTFSGGRYGFYIGGSFAVSENILIGCQFDRAADYGFYLVGGGNTLNFQLYGGHVSECGYGLFDDFSTIVMTLGVGFDHNIYDIYKTWPGMVVGCRSQDGGTFIGSPWRDNSFLSCYQADAMANFTASIDNNVMTVTAITDGLIRPGMGIEATGLQFLTQVNSQLSGDPGGVGTYMIDSFLGVPNITSTPTRAYPIFINGSGHFRGCANDGYSVVRGSSLAFSGMSADFDDAPGYASRGGAAWPHTEVRRAFLGGTPTTFENGNFYLRVWEFNRVGTAAIPIEKLPYFVQAPGFAITVNDLQYPAEGNYGRPVNTDTDGGGTHIARVFAQGYTHPSGWLYGTQWVVGGG
jgi:hypothetical protein